MSARILEAPRRAPAGFFAGRRWCNARRCRARRRAAAAVSIADQRRRQHADRREHAEPAADRRRNVERRDALRFAISRSAPFLGSVTNTRCALASRVPLFSRSRTTRYCAIVSAVPPDLEITTNSARSSEAVEQRRDRVRVDVVEHVQARIARALGVAQRVPVAARAARCAARSGPAPTRRCRAPRRRRTCPSRRRGEVGRLLVERGVVGQLEKAELARRADACRDRLVRRLKAAGAAAQSAAEMPPSTTSPIMFVKSSRCGIVMVRRVASVDANGEPIERRRDAARQLGLEVGVEVVVREVREIRALGADLRAASPLREDSGASDARVRKSALITSTFAPAQHRSASGGSDFASVT